MATNTLNAPMTDAEWQSHSLSTLTRHIVGTHHQFLREALPRLSARFAEARARTPDDTIAALGPVFAAMRAELELHMGKEEHVLFPFIERVEQALAGSLPRPVPPFGTVGNPIRMMEQEHESALGAIDEMRRITNGYTLPPEATDLHRAIYGELAELESDLRLHIHLENDILFPRAVAMECGNQCGGPRKT
jgi:regulator of cell morphogenesis and NO signaling